MQVMAGSVNDIAIPVPGWKLSLNAENKWPATTVSTFSATTHVGGSGP